MPPSLKTGDGYSTHSTIPPPGLFVGNNFDLKLVAWEIFLTADMPN